MKLFIPTIGTKLRLLADWRFDLHYEARNTSLFEALGGTKEEWREAHRNSAYGMPDPKPVTVPADTVLAIDRIYIRGAGADSREFDSLTFRVVASPDSRLMTYRETLWDGSKRKAKVRFWAKLRDVNNMDVELVV